MDEQMEEIKNDIEEKTEEKTEEKIGEKNNNIEHLKATIENLSPSERTVHQIMLLEELKARDNTKDIVRFINSDMDKKFISLINEIIAKEDELKEIFLEEISKISIEKEDGIIDIEKSINEMNNIYQKTFDAVTFTKAHIEESNKNTTEYIKDLSPKLENIHTVLTETMQRNEAITGELLKALAKNINTGGKIEQTEQTEIEDKNSIKIIYTNLKNGVLQYTLQLLITVTICLILVGGFNVISFLIKK